MRLKPVIALKVPGATKPGRYFSFCLKQDLYDEPAVYAKPDRLLAVSDIGGNFKAFQRLLIKCEVINKKYEWTFESGHLVVVGDCFKRGEQAECLWLIYSLEEKARREGGYVHFILGNHEIMNMNGDWRYIHPNYAIKKPASRNASVALYNGNSELWRWLCTKNIIEKIGDVLFVHAGICEELIALEFSLTEINSLARPYYIQANGHFTNTFLQLVFNSEKSPFCYRGYYQDIASDAQIDATLVKFGIRAIVTGHTVVKQVSSYYNGKVINVDTDHANGNSEALLITKDDFYRVDRNGKSFRL